MNEILWIYGIYWGCWDTNHRNRGKEFEVKKLMVYAAWAPMPLKYTLRNANVVYTYTHENDRLLIMIVNVLIPIHTVHGTPSIIIVATIGNEILSLID